MKLLKRILIITLFILAFGFFILLFPGARHTVISLAEVILKTALWRDFLFLFMRSMAGTGLFLTAFILFLIMTKNGKLIFIDCFGTWKEEFLSLINKSYLKWFLILIAIYFLGILTIIRANFFYNDDLNRALNGYRGWAGWGRYIAHYLSVIIHMNTRITDISPLPQFFAVIILAASTLIFIKILSPKKITVISLIAAVPIGLSPYFLENYSYKFDAPYMALAVLFSILPFLFIKKTNVFCITSFFCLLAMCMSYQAASGLYITALLIITCRLFIDGDVPIKNILKFLTAGILSYITALLFFKLVMFVPFRDDGLGYASSAMLSLKNLFPGLVSNSITYVNTIINDFKGNFLFTLIPLAILAFIIINIVNSKRNKLLTLLLILIITPVMFILSYGAYLSLQKPLWAPRAFVGFGFFIAAILTHAATIPIKNKILKYLSFIIIILISYNFLIIDLSYGNALAEQKQYQNFRTTLLISDINRYLENSTFEPVIYIENSIGYSPVIDNVSKICPLVKRTVFVALYGGSDWGHLLLHHYRFSHKQDYDKSVYTDTDHKSLPVLTENSYHTIRGNGEYFFVTLK